MKPLLLLVFGVATAAQAVPSTMPFSGRLRTSGGPVDGTVAVTFQLFDGLSGGTALWSETHSALTATNGLVFAELGSLTTLESGLFNGQPRYLELRVQSETLSPRLPLGSVPYAFRADTAEHLGALTEGDVQRPLTTGTGLALNGTTLSLSSTGCLANSVWKYDGTSFVCAPDQAGAAPTAGAGIALSGSTVSLSSTGCVAGEWWQYTGSTWECLPGTPATSVDIGVMTSGTLSTSLYSAAVDLAAEGYLDLNAPGDLLTRGQGDGRYLALTGGSVDGGLSVASTVTASSLQFSVPRPNVLSLPAFALVALNFTGLTNWGYGFGTGGVGPARSHQEAVGAIPVNLPDGATVRSLSCVFTTIQAAYMTVSLRRVTELSDRELASVTTVTSTTYDWYTVSSTTITSPVIDNRNASYYLMVDAVSVAGLVTLHRCWLEYNNATAQ